MRLRRREFLGAVAASSLVSCTGVPREADAAENSAVGRILPSAAAKYADPATEFTIVRLTDPEFDHYLPPAQNRPVTAKALLYASNPGGKWDAFRMDLKTRESRQLTDAIKLDPASLAFLPGERGILYCDGEHVTEAIFARGQSVKTRVVYRVPEGFDKAPGIALSDDGRFAAIAEIKAGQAEERAGNPERMGDATPHRLRLIDLMAGTANTVFEAHQQISDILIRPKNSAISFRLQIDSSRDELRMIGYDGNGSRVLPLAEGETLQAQWTADGRSLLYLNRPPDAKKLVTIREWVAETNANREIAATSQYVRFHANADATVFIGASGSKASPYLVLMARAVKRELTLAEHRASDARMVAPVFAPNSQFVLFSSDRHGKAAIYWIAVDMFVADTGGS